MTKSNVLPFKMYSDAIHCIFITHSFELMTKLYDYTLHLTILYMLYTSLYKYVTDYKF